jgi:hypothetical protein
MPLLEKGSLDKVKTGSEPMPEIKKIKVKIVPPTEQQKAREVYIDADGRFKMLNFGLQIQEGEFANRFVNLSCFYDVTKGAYLQWNMKDGDRPLSIQEKEKQWEEKTYLRDLKRFGQAIGVDFETQDVVDCYGKELLVDVKLREGADGVLRNEAKNPRACK